MTPQELIEKAQQQGYTVSQGEEYYVECIWQGSLQSLSFHTEAAMLRYLRLLIE